MKLLLRFIHCNTLKFQEKPTSLRTGKKSALQHSLLSSSAIFSKLMPIIHTSIFIAYFESKTLTIFTLKCTSNGGMYGGH